MRRVTIYTKPGCHLCDEVKEMIQRVQAGDPKQFDIELKNILDSAQDFAAYQYAIPVILLDGIEIARYRLREADFRKAVCCSS
jgi:glutaredoxin